MHKHLLLPFVTTILFIAPCVLPSPQCLEHNKHTIIPDDQETTVCRPATPVLPLDHPRMRAANNINGGEDPHAPEQVHITLAGPSAMAISWVTHPLDDPSFSEELQAIQAAASDQDVEAWRVNSAANKHHHHRHKTRDPCKPLVLAPLTAQVQYGLQTGNYIKSINGTFTCYWSYEYTSGALHHVVIGTGEDGPLKPNTTYYYRVGDPDRSFSQEFSFRTPMPSGGSPYPLTIAVIGDLGQTQDSVATLEHAASNNPDFVLNVGDLSYADGFQPRWDSFARLVEPSTSAIPWMVVEGNHEAELINGEKTFLAYESRYYLPSHESGSNNPLYYSFNLGPVHFLMLGSYAPHTRDSEQYRWLIQDLAHLDRSKTPWVIAAMHAPWYNSNTAHYGEGNAMQDAFEEVLYQHGVDAVFAGHVHAYERNHRVYQNKKDPCGPVHITIGDGGNWEGLDTKYLRKPKWSAFREPSFGHGMLVVHNESITTWEWHRNVDGVKKVGDSVVLERLSVACGGRGGDGASVV